jgi:hypothetical protein
MTSFGFVFASSKVMLLKLRLLIITEEKIMRTVPYPTPGEILLEEFLKPLAISQARLAKKLVCRRVRLVKLLRASAILPLR